MHSIQTNQGPVNIPMSLLRTLVVIQDKRSFTRAGDHLGLTQPAVSAQVKRLQTLIGGQLFATGNATHLTALGEQILDYARKALDINDQMLSLGRGLQDKSVIRIGIGYVHSEYYFNACAALGAIPQAIVQVAHSDELKDLFRKGHLDVICVIEPDEENLIYTWEERAVWARSRDFVLSPGRPIPIIGKLDASTAKPIKSALDRSGSQYRLVLTSSDLQTRLQATQGGLGVTVLFERFVRRPLVEAKEYYLPPIEPIKSGVCARNMKSPILSEVLQRLTSYRPGRNLPHN